MKRKLLFVAGLATGFVLGSRAGRSAYTELTAKLRAARSSDPVASVLGRAKDAAAQRAPKLTAAAESVADTTSSVAQAAATAPDPEGDAEPSAPKEPRSPRGTGDGESAKEAAQVFEEQLPDSGTIDEGASSLPADATGAADESRNPTATS